MEAKGASNAVQRITHWRSDDIDWRSGRPYGKRFTQNDTKFARSLREYDFDIHTKTILRIVSKCLRRN